VLCQHWQLSGNDLSCRLYHARRGRWNDDINECRMATPGSVYGGCVSNLVNQSLVIKGENAMVDTYCDNHIHSCGTKHGTPLTGYWSSRQQCRTSLLIGDHHDIIRSGYENMNTGRNLECLNTMVWSAVSMSTIEACRAGSPLGTTCVDHSCRRYCSIVVQQCLSLSAHDSYLRVSECERHCDSWPRIFNATTTSAPTPPLSERFDDTFECRMWLAEQALISPSIYCPIIASPIVTQCGNVVELYCSFLSYRCGTTTPGTIHYNGFAGLYANRDECITLMSVLYNDTNRNNEVKLFDDWYTNNYTYPVPNSLSCRLRYAFESINENEGWQWRDACHFASLVHAFNPSPCSSPPAYTWQINSHSGLITIQDHYRSGCDQFCRLALMACPLSYNGNMTWCLGSCSYMRRVSYPAPQYPWPSEGTIQFGNYIQCRIYHAQRVIADQWLPSSITTHCPSVDIRTIDNNICVDKTSISAMNPRGDICDLYCRMMDRVCTTDNVQYLTPSECRDICLQFQFNGTYDNYLNGSVVDTGDTFQCRMTWLIKASIAHDQIPYCDYASAYTPFTACYYPWTNRTRPWTRRPDHPPSSSGGHLHVIDEESDTITISVIAGVIVTIIAILFVFGWRRWNRTKQHQQQQHHQLLLALNDGMAAPSITLPQLTSHEEMGHNHDPWMMGTIPSNSNMSGE
jgi:hypothetical protein